MKTHMIAFGGSAFNGAAGLVTLPFIPDPVIRVNNNIIQLTDDWNIVAAHFGGAGIVEARLSTASLRIRGYPQFRPLQGSFLGGDLPPYQDLTQEPLRLLSNENATIQVTNGGAADTIGLLTLARPDLNFNVNIKGLRKIKFTAAINAAAFGMSPVANCVLADDIQQGTYMVYGFEVYEGSTVFARLIFKDQVERPGVLANRNPTERPWEGFTGGLGLLGSFQTITPPFIETYNNAAAAVTLNGFLYCGLVA